ncbi:MAG: amidohydrolase [Gemmatimonadota bacterium]
MLLTAMFVASPAAHGQQVPAASQASEAFAPDVIYHEGKVVTVNESFDIAEALAIRDGRIVAVGTSGDVRALASESTRLVNLEGRTVLPGFGDNHIHLGAELQEWEGTLISAVDDWIRGADDMQELGEALRRRAAQVPEGEWIQGGLTRVHWPNQRVPTRWTLDEFVPNHPVALTRGPHTAVLNSRALEIVGITRDTPNPPGGWIIRDERGEPSGRVLEAARRLVDPHLPAAPQRSDEEILARYRDQLRQLRRLGLTHVDVAGVRPAQLRLVQELYERWGEELPRMTAEIRMRPGWDEYDDPAEGARHSIQELEALGFHTGFGDERLKIGAIKMGADGGLSAPVYWSTEPYAGRPDFHGEQLIHEDALYQVGKRAHELGWQLGIHTIGDAATVMATDVVARILEESPRADHRHFLHHVFVKPPAETIRRMSELGIGVASHPSWTTALGGYAAESLDGDRLETQNPSRSLLDAGVWVSYGSDQLPYGPLFNIWNAVTRRGWDGQIYGPEEAVTVEEAIRLHTMGTAYQNFDEDVRGSLEIGKVADFVVLGEDILSVDSERIREIPIDKTIIGGREVYAKAVNTVR